jgi:hypothetical protein
VRASHFLTDDAVRRINPREAEEIGRFAVSSGVSTRRTHALTQPVPAVWPVVVSTVLVAAGIAGYYALRATSWAVMTDELQVVRLAESAADRLSPVPYIHGVYYGALSQLYPLLLAPFFGAFAAPTAATAAHALNALLLPSAALPAYLLARSVCGSRAAGVAAAVLTALTPWLVLTTTLLTENAAYPAFVWAVFLCYRTLAVPSPGRDALAIAGLMLAFFARTQLLGLAVALPLALVLHEARGGGLRRCVRAHAVLTGAYGLAGLAAAGLFAVGSLGVVVGNYVVPFGGDLLPDGLWSASAAHLVHVVVGCGVLPFVLAVGWAVTALVRRDGVEERAFAALFVVLVPLLTVEVASFDLRFTPGAFNQDRYLFYLAPLFAVGAAAALVQRSSLRALAISTAAAFAGFAWLFLAFGNYDDEVVIFWAAPAAAFHPLLPADPFVVVAAAVVLAATLLLLWRSPRAALAAATVCLALFGAAEAIYVFDRYAETAMTRAAKLAMPEDWIDRAVPDGSSVALVPSPRDSSAFWWEAELWNKQVEHVLRVNAGKTFSPFPATDVSIDFRRGVLRGPQPSDFLVISPSEKRFRLRAAEGVVDAKLLRLIRVERPYRLEWAVRGLTADGWTIPGKKATLRFFGDGTDRRLRVTVVLAASSSAALPLDFQLRGGGQERKGWVDPGGARPPVQIALCVPARGFADVALRTQAAVRIPDGRFAGLHLEKMATRMTGSCEADQVSRR